MVYRRRLLRYGPELGALTGSLSDQAIAGCWFELRRQGGCGKGELRLSEEFVDRDTISLGDWVACEYDDGERWYLGRVIERTATCPAGMLLKLAGMADQLDRVFPGGFGSEADGDPPRLYGCSELFPADPDAVHANLDCVSRPEDLIRRLVSQYVVPSTEIAMAPGLIEDATLPSELLELKVRGTETATSLLKDLALRARNASWGVDETGTFYLLQRRETVAAEWREGRDLLSLTEIANEDLVYNRVQLIGGLVYANCGTPPCGTYRWQGNYLQPESRARHGERRIKVSIPWIRTSVDSQAFVREFFRIYADPGPQYRVEVASQTALIRPWTSAIRLLGRSGEVLAVTQPEVIRVAFDRIPRMTAELGPVDPKQIWDAIRSGSSSPIAPSDASGFGGGPVDVTSDDPEGSESESDGSESSTEGVVECFECPETARRWQVTISGLENGICTDCEGLNGTWVLELTDHPAGCVWNVDLSMCGSPLAGTSEIRFYRWSSFTFLIFTGMSMFIAKYRLTSAFQCDGPNTLELYQSTGHCGNWPATLVLEPAE